MQPIKDRLDRCGAKLDKHFKIFTMGSQAFIHGNENRYSHRYFYQYVTGSGVVIIL